MTEYKILHDEPFKIQQKLNQWRYDYIIYIEGIATSDNDKVVLVISRTRKDEIGPECCTLKKG